MPKRPALAERVRRAGFTLVELLVVVGLLGLLAGLTLSAVQRAREAARRAQCLNHLRQLSAACQNYDSVHGGFPPTSCHHDGPSGVTRCVSLHAYLLAFLDQSPLFAAIDFDEYGGGRIAEPPRSDQNPAAIAAHLPLFCCPSDETLPGGTNYRACLGAGPSAIGLNLWGNATGPIRLGRQTSTAEITDGLSNTALFSERLTGDGDPSVYRPGRDIARTGTEPDSFIEAERICPLVREGSEHYSYAGGTWLLGGFPHTWYNHVFTPNAATPDCGLVRSACTARSLHAGGVNLTLADGSARFAADAVDLFVWRSLATRHQGETFAAW